MIINIGWQVKHDPTLQLLPIRNLTGSSLKLDILGAPREYAGETVTGVTVEVVNPDGLATTGEAEYVAGIWRVSFGAALFATYGTVLRGVKFKLVTASGIETVAIADLEVKPSSADATPGGADGNYVTMGGDQYLKSEVVDGVQHYKKVEIVYDTDMEDWGFNLTGDYVLSGSSFVEA